MIYKRIGTYWLVALSIASCGKVDPATVSAALGSGAATSSTQGAAGQTGPTGPQGATGPTGASNVAAISGGYKCTAMGTGPIFMAHYQVYTYSNGDIEAMCQLDLAAGTFFYATLYSGQHPAVTGYSTQSCTVTASLYGNTAGYWTFTNGMSNATRQAVYTDAGQSYNGLSIVGGNWTCVPI